MLQLTTEAWTTASSTSYPTVGSFRWRDYLAAPFNGTHGLALFDHLFEDDTPLDWDVKTATWVWGGDSCGIYHCYQRIPHLVMMAFVPVNFASIYLRASFVFQLAIQVYLRLSEPM